MRQRLRPQPAADRWTISWADFVTLLFAVFVLLFVAAEGDGARARRIANSVRGALGASPEPVSSPVPATAPLRPAVSANSAAPVPLVSATDVLKRELREEIEAGRMLVTSDPRRITIALRDEAFFPSGKDTLFPNATASLSKVAAVLRDLPNSVVLEGHTDSSPIHNRRFRSNWALSSARSIAVLDIFVSQFGIPAERFGIAGYADNRPVAANDSEQGRAHNRRVDIVILSSPDETKR